MDMTKKTIILIKATTLCSCMSLSAFSLFLMEDDDEQVGQGPTSSKGVLE